MGGFSKTIPNLVSTKNKDYYQSIYIPVNQQILVEIITTKMPFGKYKGVAICDLPEPYLVWFHSKGMPPGKLGMLLSTVYEIKLNGLDQLIVDLKKRIASE